MDVFNLQAKISVDTAPYLTALRAAAAETDKLRQQMSQPIVIPGAQATPSGGGSSDNGGSSNGNSSGGGAVSPIVDVKNQAEDAGKAIEELNKKLGEGFTFAAKAGAAAWGTLSTAAIAATKKAVDGYAQYEQLVGGIDTLFKESSQTVQKYAEQAYKTAGMSANTYMQTITSFSASLLNSLDNDTEKAAEKANTAITDMADNSNKMGTSLESLTRAYMGFSRGNFVMLDNLALGFSGTKQGMQELLDKAEELSGIKYDISSYADIVDAIHVVQQEMGITGTTAKEAADTIEGSMNSTKAAIDNLLVGFARSDADIDQLVGDVEENFGNLAKNTIPVAEKAFVAMSKTAISAGKEIAKEVPRLIEQTTRDVHRMIADNFGDSADTIYGIEAAIKAAAAAFVTFKATAYVADVVDKIKAVNTALQGTVTLSEALNAANLANPLVILATAAVGAGVALKSLIDTQTDLIREATDSYDLLNDSQKAVVDSQHELSASISESKQKWETSAQTIEAEKAANDKLIDRLFFLNDLEEKNTNQKAEMKAIVDKLNGSVEGLNLTFNQQAGTVDKTREEVDRLTAAYVNQIQEQRKAEKIVDLLEKQSTAEKNLSDVQKQRQGAQNKLNELNLQAASISARMTREARKFVEEGNGGMYTMTQSYYDLAAQYEAVSGQIENQKDVIGTLNQSYIQTNETLKGTNAELKNLGVTSEETGQKIANSVSAEAVKKSAADAEQAVLGFKKNAEDMAEMSFKLGNNTVTLSETTAESVGKLIDTYDEMLASQKSAILNSLDFFGGFEANANITYEEMMSNLSNVDFALNDWATAIEQLGDKHISAGLLDELKQMGLKSYDYVRELNNATPEQLKEYSDTWEKTHKDVNKVAKDQMKELKENTEEAIMQIAGLPRANIDEIKASWLSVGVDAGAGWAKGIKESFAQIEKAVEDTGEGSLEAARNVLDEHSPSKRFAQIGEFAALGFAQGIIDGTGWAADAAKYMAFKAMEAIRDELDLHSPSKKTMQIGEFFSIGMAEGIENERERVVAAAEVVSTSALNALSAENGNVSGVSYTPNGEQTNGLSQQINIYLTEDSVEPFVSLITPMLDKQLGINVMDFKV